MRIDKYLWCIRVYKTRNMASEACKKGHVKIEKANCKPSKEVYGNELIGVRKNQINYKMKVLDIPTNRVGAKLVDLYRKDLTTKEEFEKTELLKYSKDIVKKVLEDQQKKTEEILMGIMITLLLHLKLNFNIFVL